MGSLVLGGSLGKIDCGVAPPNNGGRRSQSNAEAVSRPYIGSLRCRRILQSIRFVVAFYLTREFRGESARSCDERRHAEETSDRFRCCASDRET
jgi:hypothetical protein